MSVALLVLLGAACLAPLFSPSAKRDLLAPPILIGGATFVMIWTRAGYLVATGHSGVLGFGGYPTELRDRALQLSMMVVVIGLAAFYIGHAAARGLPPRLFPAFDDRWKEQRVWLVVGLLATIGLASFVFLFSKLGSPASVLRQQHQVNLLLAGLGYPYWGAQFLLVAVIIWIAYLSRPNIPAVLLALLAFSAFFVLGRRSNLLILLLPLGVLHHYRVQRIGRAKAGIAVALLLVLFNVSLILRFAGATGVRITELPRYVLSSVQEGYVTTLMANRSEFKLLDVLMLVVRDYPAEYSYELGTSLAELPLMPIPRRWFPDKPVPYDQAMAERYVPGRIAGLPATAYGRFYMDLGVLGVVLGFLLLGALARWIFDYRAHHGTNRGAILVYALFLLFLLDFLRVADYARTLFSWLRLVLPMEMALYIASGPPVVSWLADRRLLKQPGRRA